MRVIPIVPFTKKAATVICGSTTQTSKMPCESYSLPTASCVTGFKMAQIPGSICASCYANKGNYVMYANNIEPAQHQRLHSVMMALEDAELAAEWVSGMVALIGKSEYFRWHDSGDLQSAEHLELIAQVAIATPNCNHWLPTREYGMVKEFIAKFGALPTNLMVRVSAMYFDVPVNVPASLQGVANVAVSNVHKDKAPIGAACPAPKQEGKCLECRACWHSAEPVSYAAH